MRLTYFPVLKALKAELFALSKLKSSSADDVVPLFELPKLPNTKVYQESSTPIEKFIAQTVKEIVNVWDGRSAMFDTYQWSPRSNTENSEHIAVAMYNALKVSNVNLIPVIGYDRWVGSESWDQPEYREALEIVANDHGGKFCIRLDHAAIEDIAEPDFFQKNLDEIFIGLDIGPENFHVMIDFEDLTGVSVADLFEKFDSLFNYISSYGFLSYSISGCSLPKAINHAVKTHDTCGTVLRKEMLLWQYCRKKFPKSPIYFGDYGIRGPNTLEGVPSKYINGKIRYTIDKNYYVARGHPLSQPPKGEQMWQLAKNIIESPYYRGNEFSWGDERILHCAQKEFKGNAQQWIEIDTNHHIEAVVSEIVVFENVISAQVELVE